VSKWTVIKATGDHVETDGPTVTSLPMPRRIGAALDVWETTQHPLTKQWLTRLLTMSTGIRPAGIVEQRRAGLHSSDPAAKELLRRALPPRSCQPKQSPPDNFVLEFRHLALRCEALDLPDVALNSSASATPGFYRTSLNDRLQAWQYGETCMTSGISWIAASIPERDITIVVAGSGQNASWAKCLELDRQLGVPSLTWGRHGPLPTGWAGDYRAADDSPITLCETDDVAHVSWPGSSELEPVVWFSDQTWLPSSHRLRPLGPRYAWGSSVDHSGGVRFNADSMSVVSIAADRRQVQAA
jgi:hypothetical protein